PPRRQPDEQGQAREQGRQEAGPELLGVRVNTGATSPRRVGIVTKWFNRGQPIVGRYMRSAVDSLGHESFVLARPRREQGPRPGALERTGIWDQPGVTEASQFKVP